ncbi:hypothetical protein AXF42_Ash014157 [Apostasia shenzhenica]|uniref:Uncharacterized protein n=1 Tax=Apostasia shenzhenica TaxID=1088818 RepID=A0A2I0A137_9ASPA|nr:hypothetical protein AXF42_Ash014157 [Apostasia shenzhenica]
MLSLLEPLVATKRAIGGGVRAGDSRRPSPLSLSPVHSLVGPSSPTILLCPRFVVSNPLSHRQCLRQRERRKEIKREERGDGPLILWLSPTLPLAGLSTARCGFTKESTEKRESV